MATPYRIIARHAAVVWPPLIHPAAGQFKPTTLYIDPEWPSSRTRHVAAMDMPDRRHPFLLLAADGCSLAVACQAKLPPGWEIDRFAGAVAPGAGGQAA